METFVTMTDNTQDSDSEYEEEETMILIELHGVIDSEIFTRDRFEKFAILGIDTEKPILQVENFVFTGEYEDTMGTALILEEDDKKVKKCDPVFCKKPPKKLNYVCKSNKNLIMKRVFVTQKSDELKTVSKEALDTESENSTSKEISVNESDKDEVV